LIVSDENEEDLRQVPVRQDDEEAEAGGGPLQDEKVQEHRHQVIRQQQKI